MMIKVKKGLFIPNEGIQFELNPGPQKGEDGKSLLYAITATDRKCPFHEMAEDAEERRFASAKQIEAALEAFRDEAGILLSRGYRVETPFGSFALKLRLKGSFTNPDKVKGTDVEVAGIEFTPNKKFLKLAKDNPHKPRKKNPVSTREVASNPEALEAVLRGILESRGYVNVPLFMYNAGMKRDSARNYLNSLCEGEQPLLKCNKWVRPHMYTLRKQTQPET